MRYDPRAPHHERYVKGNPQPGAKLRERIEKDALALCRALGYDLNTVEFAVEGGIPYAIDFMNPAPDAEITSGEQDIEGLLVSLESNYLGWSSTMAPVIMGNAGRPELGAELTASFCRTDPEIQKRFARATFLSDNRADLARVKLPTLVLQCSDDVIAPDCVGEYVHANVPGSTLVKLKATGHCPNLSAPAETAGAIAAFLNKRRGSRG